SPHSRQSASVLPRQRRARAPALRRRGAVPLGPPLALLLWRRRDGARHERPRHDPGERGNAAAGAGAARGPPTRVPRAPRAAMIRTALSIARSDLTRWRRAPALIAATLIPAVGMSATVMALTFAVGKQPVALVREGFGPTSEKVVAILRQSDGFFLRERTAEQAAHDLAQ